MLYNYFDKSSYKYYFLDYKFGDVTGDCIVDKVYLVGEKSSPDEIFSDNISIVIQDGKSNKLIKITMEFAAGYNAQLLLANFTSKNKKDILVKIDTGGSGGYILSYLYTLINNEIALLFDSESFEKISKYNVNFIECFNIEVIDDEDSTKFILDVENNKDLYIKNGIYDEKGNLIKITNGEVLSLGSLSPIIEDYNELFKLLAYQRIIGINNSDNLGGILTYLKWNGKHIEIERVNAII